MGAKHTENNRQTSGAASCSTVGLCKPRSAIIGARCSVVTETSSYRQGVEGSQESDPVLLSGDEGICKHGSF